SGPVVLYAGERRLDAQRCTLGEPPLTDGAVLFLGAPGDPEPHPESADAPARLHVVAGPDAGGVHLLHGGQIRIGRSADADVALDDPDVSRTHCSVTVTADGRVAVADLGSTNGTTLDGARVGDRAVRFPAGALLRIGESALRLAPAPVAAARVETAPDGEGCVRVRAGGAGVGGAAGAPGGGDGVTGASGGARGAAHDAYGAPSGAQAAPGDSPWPAPADGYGTSAGPAEPGGVVPGVPRTAHARAADAVDAHGGGGPVAAGPGRATGHTHGTMSSDGLGRRREPGRGTAEPLVPGQGGAPRVESHPDAAPAPPERRADGPPRGPGHHSGAGSPSSSRPDPHAPSGPDARSGATRGVRPGAGAQDGGAFGGGSGGRKGTPLRGTDVPPGVRRRGGLTAWARRLTGGRGEPTAGTGPYDAPAAGLPAVPSPAPAPETWPDPAALLLTALGPGPRLWERGPGHPEALTVRLGTADRAAPAGAAPLPSVPVTAGLREAGALGLAGPRERLAGLARAVLAQLAALHSPD
ncbi:FHA domain-containing protein, partial [Streptomyces sp. TRM76130]|nr:FHA domain-containing protein [Streptomyces sp. TRM76130]